MSVDLTHQRLVNPCHQICNTCVLLLFFCRSSQGCCVEQTLNTQLMLWSLPVQLFNKVQLAVCPPPHLLSGTNDFQWLVLSIPLRGWPLRRNFSEGGWAGPRIWLAVQRIRSEWSLPCWHLIHPTGPARHLDHTLALWLWFFGPCCCFCFFHSCIVSSVALFNLPSYLRWTYIKLFACAFEWLMQ